MNILIIEDSKVEAKIFGQALKRIFGNPVTIKHSTTLGEGLALLGDKSRAFDLVFLDLKLPDSEEWQDTCHSIAAFAEHVPVIVMSGESDEYIARQALQCGAEDYIVKGGKKRNVDMLKETIDFALLRHKQVQKLANKLDQEEQCVHWLSGGYSVEHVE